VTKPELKLFQFNVCYRSFCVPDAWLFCFVVNLVIHVSLGLLHISVVVLVVFILFSQYKSRDWLGKASPK